MAKIYLSSTFKDLQAHRKAACDQLVRMQHSVTAMEDYVAQDARPADRCLADVRACDLYVGILAWRYGHIPGENNPESLSITELEQRAAQASRIPTLMFLLDEAAAWPPALLDSHTGDGAHGERIRGFRGRIAEERLASFFTSPEDLAAKVGAAVHVAGTISEAQDASVDLASIVGQDAVDRPEMIFNQSYLPFGALDPLATYDLLRVKAPFVPITHNGELLKVIDRIGVATALALNVVERRLGRV